MNNITIRKNIEGALVICANLCGYLFKKTYFGYTQKEAILLFKKAYEEASHYGQYWVYR